MKHGSRVAALMVLGACAHVADLITPHMPAGAKDAVFYGGIALGLHWLFTLLETT